MDVKLIVAFIGIVSVTISALVQFYLGSHAEQRKKLIEIKYQAYLDLINVVAEIASSVKNGQERNSNQFSKLIQAKSRVVLLGNCEVVNSLHNFFINYKGKLDSDDSYAAFTMIVSEMRKELSKEKFIEDDILQEALFGKNN